MKSSLSSVLGTFFIIGIICSFMIWSAFKLFLNKPFQYNQYSSKRLLARYVDIFNNCPTICVLLCKKFDNFLLLTRLAENVRHFFKQLDPQKMRKKKTFWQTRILHCKKKYNMKNSNTQTSIGDGITNPVWSTKQMAWIYEYTKQDILAFTSCIQGTGHYW